MSEVALGIAENQKTVPVSVGDSIRIALQQNAASSGFEWGVVGFSDGSLDFDGRSVESGSHSVIGSGSQEIAFRFRARNQGPGFVELGLSRGDPKVSSSFKYRVDLDISA